MDFINQCAYFIWEHQPILALIVDIVICIAPVVISAIWNEDGPSSWSFCIGVIFMILAICSYIQFTQLVRVPKVTGDSYDNAIQTLNENELEFIIVGDLVNDYVDDQKPEQGKIVKKGEVIKLSFDGIISDEEAIDAETGELETTEEDEENISEQSTVSVTEESASAKITDSETQEKETSQENRIINIPSIEKHTQTIDSIPQNTISIDDAEIISYNDSLTDDGSEFVYSFVAKYDGYYRANISELQSGTSVKLYLYDMAGNTISYDKYCYNNEGITACLSAENEYVIKVTQDSGFSSYALSINMQKETTDVSSYTEVLDSVKFKDQRNVYMFTAPRDGKYRFGLSEMMSGTVVELYVFNDLMETLARDTYCVNGEGLTLNNLKMGETYQIQIRQDEGFSSYALLIGEQKESVDITELTEVTDSIEFIDQTNVYIFKVPVDGRYRFEIAGMKSGTVTELHMFDKLNNDVASDKSCQNGRGITVRNLKAGDEYKIQVRQKTGLSSYTLLIGKQKETVEIENKCVINDSIEFIDQRNVYSFGPDLSGNTTFTISGMKSGTAVEFYIYNELGETIASDSYYMNGDSLSIENVPANSNYTIQIRHHQGMSNYTLKVE